MGLFGFGKKKQEIEAIDEAEITFDDVGKVSKVSCNFYHGAFDSDGKLVAGTKTTIEYDENMPVEDVQQLLSKNNSDDVISQYDSYTKSKLSDIIGSAVDVLYIRRTNELEFKNRFNCDYTVIAEDKFDDGYSEFICANKDFLVKKFDGVVVDSTEDEKQPNDNAVSDSSPNSDDNVDQTDVTESNNGADVGFTIDQQDVSTDNEEIDHCSMPEDYVDPVADTVEADSSDGGVIDSTSAGEQEDDKPEEQNDSDIVVVEADEVVEDETLPQTLTKEECESMGSFDYSIEEELEECGYVCDAANDLDGNMRSSEDINNYDFGVEPIECYYNKIPILDNVDENKENNSGKVSNMSEFVDVNEKYKNLLGRDDLCVDAQNVLGVVPDLVGVQNEKAALYGRSWCKHGETSAFFNIERKFDRYQNMMEQSLSQGVENVLYSDDNAEVFVDTVFDLAAYSMMLLGYIKENRPEVYKKFIGNASAK